MPETGEAVSASVSSSTDTASAITAFAWSLTSAGAFADGGSVLVASFPTAGAHVVRGCKRDERGRLPQASPPQMIDVVRRTALLMQPFPVVRIAGSYDAARGSGLRLR